MMNIKQLEKIANDFLKKEYGLILDVPLKINGRLTKTQGRFTSLRNRLTGETKARDVELSKTLVEQNEDSVVIDVLKHELVHYALFKKNLPNSDGHPVFENELKRLGVISQCNIGDKKLVNKVQIYKCNDCDYEFIRTRKLRGSILNYKCTCGGKLNDEGKVTRAI